MHMAPEPTSTVLEACRHAGCPVAKLVRKWISPSQGWLIESNLGVQDFLLASKMFIVCEYVPQSALQLLRGGQGALGTPDQASHPPGGFLLLERRHTQVQLVSIACLTVSHPKREI